MLTQASKQARKQAKIPFNNLRKYYLKSFRKSGRKVNGTRLFGLFQREMSGSNGTPEKVVLFFRTEY